MNPIDPPITHRPTSLGADPEPLGSDRFDCLLARHVEEVRQPARLPRLAGAARRFRHAAPRRSVVAAPSRGHALVGGR